ncbi:MAG TPA: phosphoribosylglycinamide formyltransferase [Thermoleophilaceae bacterium]|nr:phosphoribosylglycinamide formyltransferase [Thermoleophilaceae bacterium]
MSFPIVVLVSGEGSNLQALIDTLHGNDVEIVGVGASRAEARGLERAEGAGIQTAVFAKSDYADRRTRDTALADWIESLGARLVVLAGFMEILSPEFIARFPNAIVNVHPALLPAFAGINAIQQALDYGVKLAGVTVHFVDEGVDSGAIILQQAFELPYPRDIAVVEQQVHEVEHELLPQAVSLIARGKVSIDPSDSRWVVIDE